MQLTASPRTNPGVPAAVSLANELQTIQPPTEARVPGVALAFFNGSFMRGTNGSHTRAAESIAYLVRTFERVVLYSFSDHPVEPWGANAVEAFRTRYPTVTLVTESGRRALLVARLKNIAVKLAPSAAKRLLRLHIPGITPLYDQLLHELPANTLFFVTFADGLSELNGIPSNNVVVDTLDVKFIRRCKVNRRASNSVDALLRLRGEIGMLSIARAVIGISATETAFFKLLFAGDTFYIPSFGRSEAVIRERLESGGYEYDLLFVASENTFNVEGFLKFCFQFSGWLQTRKIAVAGNICKTAEIQQLAKRSEITLLGYVPDLRELYRTSKACISPIDGTGLKIKLLEALRHGRPVFASQHSIDGLAPGCTDCVFPIDTANMMHILDNDDRLRRAQESACRYSSTLDSQSEVGALTALCSRMLSDSPGDRE
jgi:glycosyltransferase involved in cell wall biosynthesis